MTTSEAAEALGISVRTVQLQIKLGKIPAKRRGRDWDITPSAVERYRRESLGQRKGRCSGKARA